MAMIRLRPPFRPALLVGLAAALRAPRHTGGVRLGCLLDPPAGVAEGRRATVPALALGTARIAIAGLGRLPGPWRPTCLYRSVAECLVLRAYDVPAVVRLGVAEATEPVAAHAWVEVDGEAPPAEAAGHRPLVPPGRGTAGTPGRETDTGGTTARRWALPADGAVVVEADGAVAGPVEAWVPLTAQASIHAPADPASIRATIRVLAADPDPGAPDGPPTIEAGTVRAWVLAGAATLRGAHAAGEVDLAGGFATLRIAPRPGDPAAAGEATFWLLSLASALLLGRMNRCLVHAGAVVDPRGRAFLVVGEGGAGKSTLCANLGRAGWTALSDDHVVLARGAGGEVVVHGWPRPFGLDAGWPDGAPTGRKRRVDPASIGTAEAGRASIRAPAERASIRASDTPSPGDSARARAPAPEGAPAVHGVLAPARAPGGDRPATTDAVPLRPADAFAALVRQAGWFVADRKTAPEVLSLLEAAASRPAHRLVLGRDAFADATPVLAALEAGG